MATKKSRKRKVKKKERRSKLEIIDSVLSTFKGDSELSISDICERTKLNWQTANEYLHLLIKLGKIEQTLDRDRLKLFKLKS